MKKSLKANAILNGIRQTLAIIFPLITFPYVSRVLGKAEYGKYSFAVSIVSYFSLVASYGINNYAVREGAAIRDDKKRINRFSSELFSFNVLTTGISFIVLLFLILNNSRIFSSRVLILIQSLSIILTTIGVDWINTIYEDFLYITIRYIVIQIAALFAIFLLVNGPEDTAKYCFILVLGSYGGNLINLFYIRKYVHISFPVKVDIRKIIIPTTLLFVNSLASTIYVNSDITMLGFFTNDDLVGIYSFSSKIYNMVKYLINAMLIVAVPRLAFILNKNDKEYKKYIDKIFNSVMFVIFPATAGMFFLSKQIIMVAGGAQYLDGDLSLEILSFALFFAIVSSILTNCILIVQKLEKRCLVGTVISAVTNILLNFILLPIIGIEGAALTTVLAEFVNMLIQMIFAKKDLGVSFHFYKWTLIPVLIETFAVIIICNISKRFLLPFNTINSLLCVGISVVLSLVSYYIIIYLFRNKIYETIGLKFFKD